jgi:hypothetical protein
LTRTRFTANFFAMSLQHIFIYGLALTGMLSGLWMLALLFVSHLFKRELQRHGLRPLVMGWRAFALRPFWGPTFRVYYADTQGVVHKADCSLPGWHFPVVLTRDALVDAPETLQLNIPLIADPVYKTHFAEKPVAIQL